MDIPNLTPTENSIYTSDAQETTKGATECWDTLPNEMVREIFNKLKMEDILTCREVSHRSISVINSIPHMKSAIEHYKEAEHNKAFFADHYQDDISLSYIKRNLIAFIKKNNLVTAEQIDEIKFLVKKLNYHGMQYILAKTTQNTTFLFKKICKINNFSFKEYEKIYCLFENKLKLTEANDTLLYATSNILFELKIKENQIEKLKIILDASPLNTYGVFPFIKQLFTHKQNIALSFDDADQGTMFFRKINDQYYDITPENLRNKISSLFIGMQVDEQGKDIFILLREGVVVFYYMPDNFSNLNSENITEYNCESTEISDANFIAYKVQISKANNLMVVYGKNTSSDKDKQIEVNIYKSASKIYTYVFNKPESATQQHHFSCSPKGNYFTIIEQDYCGKTSFRFYNVANNVVREAGVIITDSSEFGFVKILYSNDGSKIFLHNGNYGPGYNDSKMIYLLPDNQIKAVNVCQANYCCFNNSGNMFLQVQDIGIINIHNLENKKTNIIYCINTATSGAKFSPNSQLLAVVEKSSIPGVLVHNTLRIYKFMDLDENKNLQMLGSTKFITEYITNDFIVGFDFYPDGTKLIIYAPFYIEILELAVE